MNLFDVYPLYDIALARAQGSYVWDATGRRYLDLYGGHAVISVGHSHPHYVARLQAQLGLISFYSNAVKMPMQDELATELGRLSGYTDYALFLSNSGAEANENALKMASFHTGRRKLIVFKKSFHGRTSLAVAATDNPSIVAPINATPDVVFLPLNDHAALEAHLDDTFCAVFIEGMQGVGGVQVPTDAFLQLCRSRCTATGTVLILDEVQSGYGRTGNFFAHQHAGIQADIITVAKGMGNGFPIGGTLLSPAFMPKHGMLGTTFGGNYLACAAGLAVLEILENENLMAHAKALGAVLIPELEALPGIKEVRGRGLMIGVELEGSAGPLRKKLLETHGIFTGSSSDPNTLRLLPALNVGQPEIDYLLEALYKELALVRA